MGKNDTSWAEQGQAQPNWKWGLVRQVLGKKNLDEVNK